MKNFHPKKNIFSKIRIVTLFFIFQLSSFSLHSQTPLRHIDLKNADATWQAVIGGKAASPCVETSYGIAVLSDGRLLSACTNSGTVIWQKSIRGRPSEYISSFGDFLFLVTDSSHINLINPSGFTLWNATCPFPIQANPLVGLDGRVFVRGKNALACYGLDGKRKWKEDMGSGEDLGDFPLYALDDGTFIAILKNPRKNCTVAARFTAFGERLEDILFTSIVTSAQSTENGILVSLKNGSLGLISSNGEVADSKWVSGSGNSGGAFRICYSERTKNAAFIFQNGSKTEAVIVKVENGDIQNRFQVGQIARKDFKLVRESQAGFFISGTYSACEFNENGTILYAATLPDPSKWTSLFYTSENYLVLCMNDWSLKGYLLTETNRLLPPHGMSKKNSYVEAAPSDPTMLSLGIRPLTNQKMAEIVQAFEQGDYGKNEKEYVSLIKAEAENYLSESMTQSAQHSETGNFFSENAVYTQNLLYVMSKTGTREFSSYFARILSLDLPPSERLSIITFAGKSGFDENGLILTAMQNLVMKKLKADDTTTLKAICDATYDICMFMGRPALNKQGKEILTYLFFPQFDKNINDYARKTFEKMTRFDKRR